MPTSTMSSYKSSAPIRIPASHTTNGGSNSFASSSRSTSFSQPNHDPTPIFTVAHSPSTPSSHRPTTSTKPHTIAHRLPTASYAQFPSSRSTTSHSVIHNSLPSSQPSTHSSKSASFSTVPSNPLNIPTFRRAASFLGKDAGFELLGPSDDSDDESIASTDKSKPFDPFAPTQYPDLHIPSPDPVQSMQFVFDNGDDEIETMQSHSVESSYPQLNFDAVHVAAKDCVLGAIPAAPIPPTRSPYLFPLSSSAPCAPLDLAFEPLSLDGDGHRSDEDDDSSSSDDSTPEFNFDFDLERSLTFSEKTEEQAAALKLQRKLEKKNERNKQREQKLAAAAAVLSSSFPSEHEPTLPPLIETKESHVDPEPNPGDEITIGSYTKSERARKIQRFYEKRARRSYGKKILYTCRKSFADNRPRQSGRFVKISSSTPPQSGSLPDSNTAVGLNTPSTASLPNSLPNSIPNFPHSMPSSFSNANSPAPMWNIFNSMNTST